MKAYACETERGMSLRGKARIPVFIASGFICKHCDPSITILSTLLTRIGDNLFQVRILSCCAVLIGANLNLKEVIFVNLAWLPKATVQVGAH